MQALEQYKVAPQPTNAKPEPQASPIRDPLKSESDFEDKNESPGGIPLESIMD